jgi:hypothetical protein
VQQFMRCNRVNAWSVRAHIQMRRGFLSFISDRMPRTLINIWKAPCDSSMNHADERLASPHQ